MIWHMLKLVWRRKRLNTLLMVEIFFSFLVLFGVVTSGLFLWSNYRRPLGFDVEDVWAVRIDVGQRTEEDWDEREVAVFDALLRETENLPQVSMVAGARDVPYDGSTTIHHMEVDERIVRIQASGVTDRFADLLGLRLVAGRWFDESDGARPWEPIVINRRLATDLFGDDDPLRLAPFTFGERDARIVGVVSDYRKDGEFQAPRNFMFRRIRLGDPGSPPPRNLLLKMEHGADAMLEEEIVGRLQAVARDYSFEMRILSRMRETTQRMTLGPLLAGGIVAGFLMVMVGLGLIGVLWQNVTQRTREIGLRRAAGASGSHVRRQILGELWLLTALGMMLGVVVLIQLPILDVVSFLPASVFAAGVVISGALILGLATASGLYPSWLATRVHPAEALHYE